MDNVQYAEIEAFYSDDERRRTSAEIELGTRWTDAHDQSFELSWVEATGELYLMCEKYAPMTEGDVITGIPVHIPYRWLPDQGMTVTVIGKVDDEAGLNELLVGWQEAEGRPGSLAWLADRLHTPI